MKNQITKSKLINLVSSIDSHDDIEYLYHYISLKLENSLVLNNETKSYNAQKEIELVNNKDIDNEISDCMNDILKDLIAIGENKDLISFNKIRNFVTEIKKDL